MLHRGFSLLLLSIGLMLSMPSLADRVEDGSHIQKRNYYPRVQFSTSMGDFIVEMDRRRAPITVNNFLRYADKGLFNNTIFHRIVVNFVIQGGGYDVEFNEKPQFDPIFNESGNGLKNEKYTISMARQNDPHSAMRQFFFNMNDNESLDPGKSWGYTVFGTVVSGYEVLDAMELVDTGIDETTGFPNVPLEPIIINKVTILPAE
ncbi:peptidylprolyl isomerase [Alteromonas facilis]|uniref:peptidylprolyl isomerase n=1 Tax=Alteromonas facilis TaxID=2048004 RepID=UPI000C290D67|nr:peptidylprolyl isomerase [Alteromonas facilis]